jgi:hypothetical protein
VVWYFASICAFLKWNEDLPMAFSPFKVPYCVSKKNFTSVRSKELTREVERTI